MKPSTLLTLAALLIASPMIAQDEKPEAAPKGPKGPGGPGAKGGAGEFFRNMDKDGDKAISKEEAGERWERLGQLDKDGDGKVTMQELAAMRQGGPGGGPGGRGEFFRNMDTDKDGAISKEEAGDRWERLGQLDKNADGKVTPEEMAAMMGGKGGPGGPGGPGREGAGGPTGPGAMFGRYDTDKDGKLSKAEVPAEMWDKLSKADDDADGLVTKAELEKVYQGMPGGPKGPKGPKGPDGEAGKGKAKPE